MRILTLLSEILLPRYVNQFNNFRDLPLKVETNSSCLKHMDSCCILTFDRAINRGFLYVGCTCINRWKQMRGLIDRRTICLFGLVLWHINHCRLFNAKLILLQKTFPFQTIQFNISTAFEC